ncbi:hypothetical protein [Deefgea rivuli]|uniref:hypothetical protein n=1 Tax=Deefgea rivuli TaxID=400948 RepID=UPI00055E24AF|nr:hypothetical protein [Deefgea rivuli]
MNKLLLVVFICLFSQLSYSEDIKPTVLDIYKTGKDGKSKALLGGLVNMDTIYIEAGSNCTQMIGMVKVDGIQFSESGATLESFRFVDAKNNQWSVPTNIKDLSSVDRSRANNFIRQGKSYFAHVQVCGSGGFASLISLYDPKVTFGAFD